MVDLLEPVIGKQGQVRLLFRGLSARWTLNDEKHRRIGYFMESETQKLVASGMPLLGK